MATNNVNNNHDVCITHMKWAPCLIKYDFLTDCKVIPADAEATALARMYHSGEISRTLTAKTVAHRWDHEVQWTNGVA